MIYPYIKRCIDIIGSITLLIILAPIFLSVALLIKITDRGPAFYKQTRIGKTCSPFSIYKLRSMVTNADKTGSYSTSKNDARITPIGRFIRKTSIDELPQLLNVLKGDMSLIGPRPDVPAQETLYTPEQWQQRHTVRPGITGLAQATMRSDGTIENRIALDLEYTRTYSLFSDIKIAWQTVISLILTKGVN